MWALFLLVAHLAFLCLLFCCQNFQCLFLKSEPVFSARVRGWNWGKKERLMGPIYMNPGWLPTADLVPRGFGHPGPNLQVGLVPLNYILADLVPPPKCRYYLNIFLIFQLLLRAIASSILILFLAEIWVSRCLYIVNHLYDLPRCKRMILSPKCLWRAVKPAATMSGVAP